jgi:ankyrin repeat protein
MPLLCLPLELLWLISSQCNSLADVNAMARCSRLLYQSLNAFLYRQNMQYCDASALTWAAARRRPGTARKVFESRDAIELPASHLQAALFMAIQNWSRVIVQLLISNGAGVNVRVGWSGYVLQAASWRGDTALVESLLDAGADINASGGHYGYALQAAAWNGHERVVRLLINRGADVNAQGGHYGNALQAASWAGFESTAGLLIDHGAVVDTEGDFYGSAQTARWRGH